MSNSVLVREKNSSSGFCISTNRSRTSVEFRGKGQAMKAFFTPYDLPHIEEHP